MVNAGAQAGQGCGVVASPVGGIQHFGKRLHVVKQGVRNGAKRLLPVVHQQVQVRLSSVVHDTGLVLFVLGLFTGGNGRALAEQAHHQQHVGKRALLRGNANVHKGVQVKQAHLDIFHAIFFQRQRRALMGLGHALGANAGVKLVLDLQQVGVELFPVVAVAHAQLLVKRVGRANGGFQRLGVFVKRVKAHVQLVLGPVLVPEVAHAQAGGVGTEQSARHHFLQV